jgi:site-specific recombinase XerD
VLPELPLLTAKKAARQADKADSRSPSETGLSFFAAFSFAVDDYLAALRRELKSEGSIALYERHLGKLGLFLSEKGLFSLADVTSEVVTAFRDHELARERRRPGGGALAATTLALEVTILRGFFRHLQRRGLVLLDPAVDLQAPRRPHTLPKDIPSARQMKSLVLSVDTRTPLGKRDRAILELLYSSGLRNAELCGLTRGHVDLERRTVFVEKGKGGKDRLVPMGKKAAEALAAYIAVFPRLTLGETKGETLGETKGQTKGALFLNRAGGRLGGDDLRRILSRSGKKARLSVRATPHTLRHACATHLLRGGAGIRQIQTLLGHASLSATEIYTKVETSDLKRMLDKHHPRSEPEGQGEKRVGAHEAPLSPRP